MGRRSTDPDWGGVEQKRTEKAKLRELENFRLAGCLCLLFLLRKTLVGCSKDNVEESASSRGLHLPVLGQGKASCGQRLLLKNASARSCIGYGVKHLR